MTPESETPIGIGAATEPPVVTFQSGDRVRAWLEGREIPPEDEQAPPGWWIAPGTVLGIIGWGLGIAFIVWVAS